MIIIDNPQGSDAWFQDRLGIATGSCFSSIMTLKQMKRAKTDYIYLLAAEAITGEEQTDRFENRHTQRGNALEPEAIAMYEFSHDVDVIACGLCKPTIESMYGCSPDGLVGATGGLEVKSPELKKHLQYIAEDVVPDEYKAQVYGCLFVTGRDYWDFMSYNVDYRPFYKRTTKEDAGYIKWAAAFEPILAEFLNDLKIIIEQ